MLAAEATAIETYRALAAGASLHRVEPLDGLRKRTASISAGTPTPFSSLYSIIHSCLCPAYTSSPPPTPNSDHSIYFTLDRSQPLPYFSPLVCWATPSSLRPIFKQAKLEFAATRHLKRAFDGGGNCIRTDAEPLTHSFYTRSFSRRASRDERKGRQRNGLRSASRQSATSYFAGAGAGRLQIREIQTRLEIIFLPPSHTIKRQLLNLNSSGIRPPFPYHRRCLNPHPRRQTPFFAGPNTRSRRLTSYNTVSQSGSLAKFALINDIEK